MNIYASEEFYEKSYLLGRKPIISTGHEFYFREASCEIDAQTFNRLQMMHSKPEEVRFCCCELAEYLYSAEQARQQNGAVLTSYSNDGESASFGVSEFASDQSAKRKTEIIQKYLAKTGLLYRGMP